MKKKQSLIFWGIQLLIIILFIVFVSFSFSEPQSKLYTQPIVTLDQYSYLILIQSIFLSVWYVAFDDMRRITISLLVVFPLFIALYLGVLQNHIL